MGYYYQFHCKIALIKDTPKEVVRLFDGLINTETPPVELLAPSHKLFTLDRWESLFHWSAFLDEKPSFGVKPSGYYLLELHCDINYGYKEIMQFVDFITPFVAGRKKKQYIGWYQGDNDRDRFYLHIKRN